MGVNQLILRLCTILNISVHFNHHVLSLNLLISSDVCALYTNGYVEKEKHICKIDMVT